jgi:hypothetical protein
MSNRKDQVTQFLNLSDRVELFSDMTHDAEHHMDVAKFDALTDGQYAALEHFFYDMRQRVNEEVLHVEVEMEGNQTIISLHKVDGSVEPFHYSDVDVILP